MKRQLILPILFVTAAGCAAEPAAEHGIASLRGAEPDCQAVVATPAGDLVPTRALRVCFDHFLTGRGEVDDVTIRAALDQTLSAQLPAEAHAQAMLQYERYLTYLEAARALAEAPGAVEVDPAEAQARLAREHLGPEVAEA
ncbi:MAG: hypothetical protein KC933_13225, partial [Myxococcales bacterium]|nr:hypothetical protein [Myxococcales bacterium]